MRVVAEKSSDDGGDGSKIGANYLNYRNIFNPWPAQRRNKKQSVAEAEAVAFRKKVSTNEQQQNICYKYYRYMYSVYIFQYKHSCNFSGNYFMKLKWKTLASNLWRVKQT